MEWAPKWIQTSVIALWNSVRPSLSAFRRLAMFQRPFGLKSLGKGSYIARPRILLGRKQITIGSNSQIHSNCMLMAVTRYGNKDYTPKIEIGSDVYIGRHVYITAIQEISIGDHAVLSEHVYITDLNHGFDPNSGPIMRQALDSKGSVRIGQNCFLGYRVSVMPGVILGDWCIVGANSVVTASFPAYSMIGGAPARLIKTYSRELGKWIAVCESKDKGVKN